MFEKKGRETQSLTIVLDGIAGSGKTFTALRLAHAIGKKVFVIDSERGSSRLYFGEMVDGVKWDFPSHILPTFSADCYIQAIDAAVEAGADVIVIDGLSQAWNGENGILEFVEMVSSQRYANGKERGTYQAWGPAGKVQERLFNKILTTPPNVNVIATMRAKVKYATERDDTGKLQIKRLGVKPIQRSNIEFEFDVIMRMEKGVGTIFKSRCKNLPDGSVWRHPGKDFAEKLLGWKNESVMESVPGTLSSTVPEPASDSQEWTVEEMRSQLTSLLSEGRIQREDILQWRAEQGILHDAVLTEAQTYDLASAMVRKAQAGTAEEVPF